MFNRVTLFPIFSGLFLVLLFAFPAQAAEYDIELYDHEWSWSTFHTGQIQAAIDDCAQNGGGTVVVPDGYWISGTIFLKDNVELKLEEGATIISGLIPSLFPVIETKAKAGSNKISNRAMIYAEGQQNISVTGKGSLISLGLINTLVYEKTKRPHIIKFVGCNNVTVRNVTLEGASTWTQLYLLCTNVTLDSLTVYSVFGSTSDGLDIDSSTNVTVTDCVIDSYDDAIALKSTTQTPCTDVTVTGCTLRSGKRGIKIGTESIGGFSDISFKDCTVERGERTIYNPKPKDLRAGIFLTTVDGGNATNISFDDIRLSGAKMALYISAGKRKKSVQPGVIKNVTVKNITATSDFPMPSLIVSDPIGNIRNIEVANFLTETGNQTIVVASPEQQLKSRPGKPSYNQWGTDLPNAKLFISGLNVEPKNGEIRP